MPKRKRRTFTNEFKEQIVGLLAAGKPRSEIIGYSSGPNKTAALVQRAFVSVPYNLKQLKLFHTDRGNEFKN